VESCALNASASGQGQVMCSYEHNNEPSDRQGVIWLAKWLLASEEGVCSMELVKKEDYKQRNRQGISWQVKWLLHSEGLCSV